MTVPFQASDYITLASVTMGQASHKASLRSNSGERLYLLMEELQNHTARSRIQGRGLCMASFARYNLLIPGGSC